MKRDKRLTITVNSYIDDIRDQLQKTHGVDFTYVQTINFLVHYYRKHTEPPRTVWAQGKSHD